MLSSLLKSLAAILIGNAIYFLLIAPHIPAAGRHEPFKLDLGLVIDFWTCLASWGVIELVSRRKPRA